MLEDDFTYVLRKALLGHGLAPALLAAQARVPEQEVLAFLKGSFSADLAARVAPPLVSPRPLSPRTRAIIRKHADCRGSGGWIFPSETSG